MTGKVLNFNDISAPDKLGTDIANKFVEWKTLRQSFDLAVQEVRKYVFATDTTMTTNAQLPWKNKTTIPKLCQTYDNLNANYMATLFPKRKSYTWLANEKDANSKEKRDAILNYMYWCTSQDHFRYEASKLVADYLLHGNAFATVEWLDQRSPVETSGVLERIKSLLTGGTPYQVGYVGPALRRINPDDIVFNPTAPSFIETPKIIRSLVSWGEVKKILSSQSTTEDQQFYEDLYNYLKEIRVTVRNFTGDFQANDAYYQMDGFSSYRNYLESDYVEILTFYGDIFDWETEEYLPNHKIMVVDRHKIISKKPNPSYFGFPPIFHVGWRTRPDNLWAMGPLFNLVGMQYRVDHIENLKADVFDLITFPVLKIKGYVEDFNWGPMERIYTGEEGDVEMLVPPFQVLQANIEIDNYLNKIEEMAGAPKEAMGFRSPGEKTAYEVSRLENAASRIYQHKTIQFEIFEEQFLNAMLEMGRRNLNGVIQLPIFDDEFKIQVFESLNPSDLVGSGRIRPLAARNFAEKAEMIQNLSNFYASGPGMDPQVRQHISSVQTAKLAEYVLDWGDWNIVQPFVRITEAADAQRLSQTAQEQVAVEQQTPSGLTPSDTEQPFSPQPPQPDQGQGQVNAQPLS